MPSPGREQEILQVAARYRNYPGVLTVTNQHLTFTRRTSPLTKRRRTTLFLALASIGEVTVSGESAAHTLVVRVHPPPEAGPDEFALTVDSPTHVRAVILDQVQRQRARAGGFHGNTSGPPSVSVVIQTPVVAAPPKIMVRCPYCHTVYPELDARCPSCGGHF
ncbi:MAG: hypothetical protein WB778_05950 [Thermoplasmata archaeon]